MIRTTAEKRSRNKEYKNSNIAILCPEPTYLTRTSTHASTPPGTPAKGGKLLATVAGRDMSAQQLQHSEHRKSFVHCNSAILDRDCQFKSSLSKRADHQASHYWQRKLILSAPTTHIDFIDGGINQIDFTIGQGLEQIFINHKLDITTFKNTTVTKTAIKQASALNETYTKPVECRAEIKSVSTSAQEIIAHDPWLTSNTPSSEASKHVAYSISWHTCKQEQIIDASIQIVVPPKSTHLTNMSQQWTPNSGPSKMWGSNIQVRSFVTLYNKVCHTPQQISPGQQDQAGTIFMEESKWCIKKTVTSNPFKKTQELSCKFREKSSCTSCHIPIPNMVIFFHCQSLRIAMTMMTMRIYSHPRTMIGPICLVPLTMKPTCGWRT